MSFLMLLGWFDVIMETSDLVPRETAFQSEDADEHGSFPRFVFRALPVPWHELNSVLMGSANDVTNALLKSKILQAMTPIHANSMMGYPDPPSLFVCARSRRNPLPSSMQEGFPTENHPKLSFKTPLLM
jgi:hypothetical protein